METIGQRMDETDTDITDGSSSSPDRQLTGRDYHAMALLGAIPGMDGVSQEEAVYARLTLLHEGADAADPQLARELLEEELPDYLIRTDPVQRQLHDGPVPLPQSDGTQLVGDITVQQLRGYHRRLLASVGDIRQERALLGPMTGCTPAQLDEMPIGTYQSLVHACLFFILEAIRAISPRSSASPASE